MNNKSLAIFGIATYILSVVSSATNQQGESTMPVAVVVISGIATTIFIIIATIRLWKVSKISSILLTTSSAIFLSLEIMQINISPAYGSSLIIILNITKIISLLIFFWAVILLWRMGKQEVLVKNFQKDSGLSSEEFSLTQKKDIVPDIGKEISWSDIINHVFRVLKFDRNGTTITKDDQVKAKSSFEPYGYLLAESPIFNNRVRMPIIHRDDFLLAASVFDEPQLADLVESEELLVTYSPKHLLPKGLSGSPLHVLHYVIVPTGTLDYYYSVNNDMHMAKPEPQKLFGPFVYQGEIKVQINSEPKL